MDESVKQHLKSESQWLRVLFMLLFWVLMQLTRLVVGVVVLSQVVFVLMTGSPNENLLDFSSRLNRYIFQILQFLTYHSEQKPFPFSDWPQA